MSTSTTRRVYDCAGSHAINLLKKIYTSDDFDVMLTVDLIKIPAHKLILSANSDYFKSMLCGSYKETQMKEITFQDMSGIALEACVRFCYLGQIEFTADNVYDVISVAIMMQFNAIEKGGWKFLVDTLSPQSVLEVIAFADLHARKVLVEDCLKYAFSKIEAIVQLPNFQSLDKDHLIAFVKQAKSLGIVSDTAMLKVFTSWINVTQAERQKESKHFLACFDLKKSSVQFIWNHIRPFCSTDSASRAVFEAAMSLHLMSGEKLETPKPAEEKILLLANPHPVVQAGRGISFAKPKKTILLYENKVLMRLTFSNQHYLYWYCPAERTYEKIALLGHKISYQNQRWGNRILHHNNKSLEFYDLESGETTHLPKIEGGLIYFCVVKNELFALSKTCHIYKYDSNMDVWTVFSLPFRAYKDETGASAIVLGSKLYIIGGCNQELPAKCFDFQTKLWFTLTNPSVFRSFVRLVVCNGCIYAFGGTENELPGAWNNLIEKYNPQSNLWSRLPDWHFLYDSPLFVSTVKDHIYAITTDQELVTYNGIDNSITNEGDYKSALSCLSAVVINSK